MQVHELIPVLKDAHPGADTHLDHFAHTKFHVKGPAAAMRTDELAGQIQQWDFWRAAELRQRKTQWDTS